MPSSKIEPSDAQRTDEAWQRLQQRLALEPVQPQWAAADYGPAAAQAAPGAGTAPAKAPQPAADAAPAGEPAAHGPQSTIAAEHAAAGEAHGPTAQQGPTPTAAQTAAIPAAARMIAAAPAAPPHEPAVPPHELAAPAHEPATTARGLALAAGPSAVEAAPTPPPGERAASRQSAVQQGAPRPAGLAAPAAPAARGWLRKRRRWAALAAACCVFAAIVATPTGNDALAAMLNKFRMQQVTVVQEDDLRSLFNQLAPEGQTREQINKFGSFSQTSGKLQGEYTAAEAAKLLGRKLIVPEAATADGKPVELYITPSNKLTFRINVAEVNGAMKRLGAKTLLPSSIDGKTVALDIGESAEFNVHDDSRNTWYSFNQQPVPVITVDPSVPVAEGLKAVLDFPLLPAQLKESLTQSDILSGGNVPIPVFAQGHADKVNVGGTEVVVTDTARGDRTYYEATWVKDGQLYQLSGGTRYTDAASLLAKIKELMSQ